MASNFGIKVSHPNFSVRQATGDQVQFTSAERSIKIFKSGKGTTDGTGVEVSHGFSTVPGFMVFDTGSSFQTGAYAINVVSYSTATDMRLRFPAAGTYKYYILGEEATDGYSSTPTDKAYGLVVAKDGASIESSMQDLIVQSQYPSPLVLDNKTITKVTSSAGFVTGETTHDLGFAPAFMFNVSYSGYIAGYSQNGPVSGDFGLQVDINVDATKIYIQVANLEGYDENGAIWTDGETVTANVVLLNLDLEE